MMKTLLETRHPHPGAITLCGLFVAGALVGGCSKNKGLSGEYTDPMGISSYTFKPNGKLIMSTLGARTELEYEVDGKDVKIKMPGAAMLLSIEEDGSLGGPMRMRFRKTNGSAEVRAAGLAPEPRTGNADVSGLQGSWKFVQSTYTRADGTTGENTLKCRLEFSGNRENIECPTNSGSPFTLTNAVRVVRPGRLRLEGVESTVQTNVGRVVEVDFSVDHDRLLITNEPSKFPNAPATAPVRSETVYERERSR